MQIKKAILAIDDDELILEMLKAELSDSFHVKTSTSGKHALEILEYQIPDMIILDISMPEMDGFTLCKILKENPEISHIPIMFLTALEESTAMIKAFHVGAVDFMIKPVNFLELKMRLNLHIEQAEATSALLAQNIEQSKKINSLHDQLSKHQAFLEQKEPKRERSLSERADFHQKMHQTTENNQEALVRLNELLRKQEELIKATKKTMNL